MERADERREKKEQEYVVHEEIFSRTIRAGKRTYFFDVKNTRNNEYYLTITESKRKFIEPGNFRYEKHKLFLYGEDFDKFSETLEEVIRFIRKNQPEISEGEEPIAAMEPDKKMPENEL